ncbi:unnamed protein product [Cylicocyclus nassatus]|uniref:Uncharacterized protein n=1 Tax=Cylicocyclus nassatus TaxID=53992 RepID=A0AA36LZT8_CYLNA|nr:unnamed protein product [Cylicocyclus nassatus]
MIWTGDVREEGKKDGVRCQCSNAERNIRGAPLPTSMLTRADLGDLKELWDWAECVIPGIANKISKTAGMLMVAIVWAIGAFHFIIYWPYIFQKRVEGAMKGWKEATEVVEENGGESRGAALESAEDSESGSASASQAPPEGVECGGRIPPCTLCTLM